MTQLVHLRAGGSSLLLDARGEGLPVAVHWGSDLGDLDDAALAAVADAGVPAVPHSGFDEPQPVELLPQHARGHAGRGVLAGGRAGADWSASFSASSVAAHEERVVVEATDVTAALQVRSEVEVAGDGLLRLRHVLRNVGDTPYELASLPVQLPVPAHAAELLDLTGRWSRERSPQRHPYAEGAWVREGRRGRTGHDATLVLVAGTAGFGFRRGEVWGVHVAWSGDTTTWAERLPEGRSALGGGELLRPGEAVLDAGEEYATPWLYAAHSTEGLDGLATAVHRWLRSRPQHPATPRPVVLNTWEAVYFDHDLDRLRGLADAAAALGVERFVLDDGWFRNRRSDRAGLGDWYVDEVVWPQGLGPLVDHVTGLGLEFGIWVEPEMVNLDSDLARAHPDWLLAVPGRTPPAWRFQQVLDLAHPDAWAYLLERMDDLLSRYAISYLKWDHNRDLVDAQHAGRPGVRAQTLAFYALLDELRRRHPGVEIESCASGGARIDLEVLQRTDRVWASDCTDAMERQAIQRWTGQLLTPELVGAHVSSPRNHQTGRVLDLSFRAGTALFGSFGVEWDVTTLTAEQRAELAAWIETYKRHRTLLHSGEVVRADDVPDDALVHGVVAGDRSEALFAAVQLRTASPSIPRPLRLPGLDPRRSYRVEPVVPGTPPYAHQLTPPPWLAAGGTTLPGSALAAGALAAPMLCPGQLLLLHARSAG